MNRLSFFQLSKINSENIIETDEAVRLKKQEAILFAQGYHYIKTCYIDNDLIDKYTKDSVIDITNNYENKNQDLSYRWQQPTLEEWNKKKHLLRDITVRDDQQPSYQQYNEILSTRRNGVILLSNIKESEEAGDRGD